MSGMVVALLSLPCHAQTKDGGISADMLKEIQQSQKLTTADKALFNAVASNSIDNLAQNYANQGALDTYFSVETKSQNITDQKQSGRCWMFSGDTLKLRQPHRLAACRPVSCLSLLLGSAREVKSLPAGRYRLCVEAYGRCACSVLLQESAQ